jgi:hypothetical protein
MSCVINNFVVPSNTPSLYTFTVIVDSSSFLFSKDGYFKRIRINNTSGNNIWNAATTETTPANRLMFAGGTVANTLAPYSDIVQQFNLYAGNGSNSSLINAFSSVTQYK